MITLPVGTLRAAARCASTARSSSLALREHGTVDVDGPASGPTSFSTASFSFFSVACFFACFSAFAARTRV